MTRGIDITPGLRFGRLVTLRQSETVIARRRRWECECDCGAVTMVPATSLRLGLTRSCGCLRRELSSQRDAHRDANGRIAA